MNNRIKLYQDSNKICPFCNRQIELKEVLNDNFVYTYTRRKSKILAHKNCFERKIKI